MIVTFVLYRLYSVMRGTIAAQIFIGLILIIAVSFISRTLDMKLLSWILRTVGDVWVIALIIIFQPELRRILLLVGRRGLIGSLERYDVNRAIDELVSAAEEVSLRRFGLLIVVTLRTDISFSVDTGVPIDAIQHERDRIAVPEAMLGSGEHFVLEVQGDSMINAGILDGDHVVIRRSDAANSGEIVVALIEGEEATLKRLRKKGASIALEAANPAYETRIYGPDQVEVQGKLAQPCGEQPT